MGIQFVKLKKIPTDQPIPVKQGQVRGNKNIFKFGLNCYLFVVKSPLILSTNFNNSLKLKELCQFL